MCRVHGHSGPIVRVAQKGWVTGTGLQRRGHRGTRDRAGGRMGIGTALAAATERQATRPGSLRGKGGSGHRSPPAACRPPEGGAPPVGLRGGPDPGALGTQGSETRACGRPTSRLAPRRPEPRDPDRGRGGTRAAFPGRRRPCAARGTCRVRANAPPLGRAAEVHLAHHEWGPEFFRRAARPDRMRHIVAVDGSPQPLVRDGPAAPDRAVRRWTKLTMLTPA